MAVRNPTNHIMYPRHHIQSPLLRRRERKVNGRPIYENTSTSVLGVPAGEHLGKLDDNGEINVTYHIVREDNKIHLITDLSTEHVTSVPCVPIRIVLLVDRSGSMIHYFGQKRRYTKITQVKRFAMQLIQSLDIGDEAGIVTFGTDADIFYPLTGVTDDSKAKMLSKLETLDGGRMCRKTNLSAGLKTAFKVFKDAIKT
ncbi:hypothetical protein CHS0354_003990 [Potamilus streckersoni]|uniref:VWFA domain-containing protein n=1 Tax=Potamilus streckersoni TaxID=2493646 RepID=A0AAE0VLV6_9BIVA|nr:hypothetical protein CHS0354_003990 [Potamilus streckersoni]